MAEVAAMHFDRDLAGDDRHVDFGSLPPPDFPLRSGACQKHAVKTSAERAKRRSLRAPDLVEMHRCEFFSRPTLKMAQESVAHAEVLISACALR
jgi:hypothetical protein